MRSTFQMIIGCTKKGSLYSEIGSKTNTVLHFIYNCLSYIMCGWQTVQTQFFSLVQTNKSFECNITSKYKLKSFPQPYQIIIIIKYHLTRIYETTKTTHHLQFCMFSKKFFFLHSRHKPSFYYYLRFSFCFHHRIWDAKKNKM